MNNNEIICELQYHKKITSILRFFCIATVFIILPFILSFVPIREETDFINLKFDAFTQYVKYNIFGETIYAYFEPLSGSSSGGYANIFTGEVHKSQMITIIIFAIFLFVVLCLLFFRKNCRMCCVELHDDGICGKLKKAFSTKSLDVPIEKIDSIYIRNNLFDKIVGGETIALKTGSSIIRISCVTNAKSFIDKTLIEIKKYKQSIAKEEWYQNNDYFNNEIEKINKLKELFNQGLISEEEFNAKRKELLEKI